MASDRARSGFGRGALVLSVLAGVAALAGNAAADPAAGRQKAAMCQVCHGYDGIGTNPEVPNIGGESDIYLMRQLKAFRSGERQHQQMSIIASGLSDDDIRNLADYYSSIEITATVPNY
ncbi:cytochrome c [Acuticoccus sp. M5D2P5]|uniref:c-type cytochrome n=1 Tax=Acuticoccus kalidii TaxID=2910977 RepID=UPI001F2C363F|nr:cytochrome c [Acuticoccus kalidii]MCF3933572.1 cytochrome c [Acuticoccus kalidii]